MSGVIAKVVLDGTTYAFDKPYTYAVPDILISSAKPGCRAVVPFGRANLKKQCMIIAVENGETDKLKSILSVTDGEPVLNDEMLGMCEFMHDHFFCTYFDAVHAMLPTGINYQWIHYYSVNRDFCSVSLLNEQEKTVFDTISREDELSEDKIVKSLGVSSEVLKNLVEKEAIVKSSVPRRKMGDASERWVRLSVQPEELESIKLTPRQREVIHLIRDAQSINVKEILYFTGVTVSVINTLQKKGLIESFEKQVFRTAYQHKKTVNREDVWLTDEQYEAYTGMYENYKKGKGSVSLLYGVTGSGKTQVFLKLVDKVSDSGRGVIVMVPEIALTPQIIEIFSNRYGNKIAVFHSAMSLGQRMDEWKRIKNGDALIAIGTRSAIFAPFDHLGLIIIDEEQEHTYKSEKTPRFNTRDLAKYRVAYHKGLLCLASATPSVESYTAAKNGKYSLFTLRERYGSSVLPEVETVDMRKEILSGNSSSISNLLFEGITDVLKQQKQAIILLNRRGHNTYISCPDCGYVAVCPNCSISLTYHSANERLMCHYCGYSEKASKKCPQCGKENMKYMGIGTQKVAEELKMLFPKARVLRLDADSTMTRDSYSSYLTDFSAGKYDIMLGTQMVAKGLDFSNVTLVGVLGADSSLYSDDYRSFERTFSLLTQVVGRAGRGENPGRAIIQSIEPNGRIIDLAKRQDYDSFYEDEIMTRKVMIYPPYCDMCVVSTQAMLKNDAEFTVNCIFGKIKEMIDNKYNDIRLIILGPSPASIPRVNKKYRYRMIIKVKNTKKFREMLREAINVKAPHDTVINVDINPETII